MNKQRIYVIKAELVFKDGINKGSIKVRAPSYDEAVLLAKARLLSIWACLDLIQINFTK